MFLLRSTEVGNDMITLGVFDEGRKIYNENIHVTKYNMYYEFIQARLKELLQDGGKLHKPYVMFECANRMYALDDLEYTDNHRELKRQVVPLGFSVDESYTFDLILDSTLHDVITYEADHLVFRFDMFYLNGKELYSLDSINKKKPEFGKEFDCSNVDFKRASGKEFHDFIRFIQYKEGIQLKGFVSRTSEFTF